MSGIAKPHVHFATSKTPAVLVNIDHVQNAEKIDIKPSPITNNKAEYLIILTSIFPNGQTKENKISFTTAALRNTAFSALVAHASTPL